MPHYQPQELHRIVEQRADAIGIPAFVTHGRHKRLREMWCAAAFARGYERNYGECQVDVDEVDEQLDYDFQLILPCSSPLPFQLFEVLDEGRRRSDEYKDVIDRVETEPPRQKVRGSSYATRRLRAELEKKIAKHYANAQELHLLVYLNLNAGTLPWVSMASEIEFATPSFASIWVVTHDLIACLHGGNRWAGKIGWKSIDDPS